MAKKTTDFTLDYPFYKDLYYFYKNNEGAIRKTYKGITRKILDYNIESGFLRQPQIEALEIYIFIKEYLNNIQVSLIFDDFYNKRDKFENRKNVIGYTNNDGQDTLFEELANVEYKKVLKHMTDTSSSYSNYIYALTMGTGKTILMATCIFYEFLLANKFPADNRFCHNALVFAPDKTVLQSLREIETFDKSLVIPTEQANWLESNLRIHFLDDVNSSLNILDGSNYNIVISNTQKIILKKQHKEKELTEQLFNLNRDDYIGDLDSEFGLDSEDDLRTNQRFQKLERIKQLGIYVDEAHHSFGTTLESDMLETKAKTSLRKTIDELSKSLDKAGTKVVACYNYTGTPYIKNQILPEVVYAFGLKEAINKRYLKEVELHDYTNPTEKDFLRFVIDDFLTKYNTNRYEGMLPKLAIFASKIDEIQTYVKPFVEEILTEKGISIDKILVNVGDAKLTTDDDIREFNKLDTSDSEKQFILLVNKGKEGWNCRSLFGVALYRKPTSRIFVLQATMRCMRSITKEQQMANVYLSDENYHILEEELQETFRVSTQDLKNTTDKKKYIVKLVPPPVKVKLKKVRMLYNLKKRDDVDSIDFDFQKVELEKYKIIETISDGIDNKKKVKEKKDLTEKKEKRKYSELTLVAEISRYLNTSCISIQKILNNSKDGIEAILSKVNEYNELLYDWIIPELVKNLYIIEEFEYKEDKEVELTKDPGDEGYLITASPELVAELNKEEYLKYKEKSFHLDTYCFDSAPEKDFFWRLLNDGKIEKVYFTGMITNKQYSFFIEYIDPYSNRLRSYFPDFVVKNDKGQWIIFEIKGENRIDKEEVRKKQEYAEKLTSDSNWKYILVPSTQVKDIDYFEDDPKKSSSLFA